MEVENYRPSQQFVKTGRAGVQRSQERFCQPYLRTCLFRGSIKAKTFSAAISEDMLTRGGSQDFSFAISSIFNTVVNFYTLPSELLKKMDVWITNAYK